mmetsp:Transcript_22843/g.51726  ORF Transcript_22843/g.51726 Transcript_22843/m.51726 type:complete len:203 (-) Transcript_22843:340-948(-)
MLCDSSSSFSMSPTRVNAQTRSARSCCVFESMDVTDWSVTDWSAFLIILAANSGSGLGRLRYFSIFGTSRESHLFALAKGNSKKGKLSQTSSTSFSCCSTLSTSSAVTVLQSSVKNSYRSLGFVETRRSFSCSVMPASSFSIAASHFSNLERATMVNASLLSFVLRSLFSIPFHFSLISSAFSLRSFSSSFIPSKSISSPKR